jgi:hypothetical protein
MQSENYVPGVSGWKLHKGGFLEIDGVMRISGLAEAAKETPKPFVVVDGVVYINRAQIKGSVEKSVADKIFTSYSAKIQQPDGHVFRSFVGVPVSSGFDHKPDILVKADSIEILPDGMVRIKQK